ncbi:MAG: tyrosine--tRNA ligase, partial [Prevotellaceae bacterium]|nr:tyrosine--tRNA ligase [Prevotellaceae bacterium]
KIFTLLSKNEIEVAITQHLIAPQERQLQKLLAKEITCMVHGEQAFEKAVNSAQILFGQGTSELLNTLDEASFLSLFQGVPQFEIETTHLPSDIVELLAVKTAIFPSKGECRKMIQGGGVSLNKEKITTTDLLVERSMLFQDKYLLIQKGKKNYFIIKTITL